MKATILTIFCISMFLLSPINSYVNAEVVEQTKVFHIEQSDIVNYASVLNIVNSSNNQYTNYEKLVTPFIENTSISGGYSGSFLPPSKFQLNSATGSALNDHLILTSFVEFEQKNLLSGSSVSWWRCPYFYNGSQPDSRDWILDLSIYHVDLPRQVNISWEKATGSDNYPAYPTNSAHPSLIFKRDYTDCGQTQDDKQYDITTSFTVPANDTLVNPNMPLNLTAGANYNPHKYHVTLDYSFSWFNVTAPIYPNESYMVIWDIQDNNIGSNDAGSCWITATDVGGNGYGRSLISWNSQDIYEMPIDLDTSVLFQYGIGAGVSGHKLLDNDPDVQDHTALFSNPSFETATFQYEGDFSSQYSWDNYYTKSVSDPSNAWIRRDATANQVEFRVNKSGHFHGWSGWGLDSTNQGTWAEIYDDFSPLHFSSEGTTFRFDLSMEDANAESTLGSISYYGSAVKFALWDTNALQGYVIIKRFWKVETGTGVITTDNRLYWLNSGETFSSVALPEVLPKNLYVTLQCGLESGGDNYIFLYDQSAPNYVFFSQKLTNNYRIGSGLHPSINTVLVSAVGVGDPIITDTTLEVTDIPVVTLRTTTGCERTQNMNGWAVGGTWTESPSKHDFFGGFETTVPNYDPQPSPINTKAFGFIQESSSPLSGYVSQYSSITSLTNRRFFANVKVRLMPDSLNESTANSYFRLQLSGYDGTWHNSYSYFRMWDGAWHTISSNYLTGSFTQLFVSLSFQFEGATTDDHKLGLVDALEVLSIGNGNYKYSEFNKEIDKSQWTATNYYSLMLPFKYSVDPDFPPLVTLEFKDSADVLLDTFHTNPSDFYGDFIMYSIKTSEIDPNSAYVNIKLYNFCNESYIFLFDKNNEFTINDKFETKYNHIGDYDSSSTLISENFFSPYYSLRTTEGQWVNADSLFTTTYFYYVVVHFVEFKDNDPQVISIRYDSVNVQDVEFYRKNLKAFGEVYSAEEWKIYLDIRNRPSFSDQIWDAYCDFAEWVGENNLGFFISPFGFMIWKALDFLAPYLEVGLNFLIDIVQFIISVVIFIFAVWSMWKFVAIWIMIGEGRTEEGIAIADDTSSKVIDKVKGAISSGVGMIAKIGSGGVG